MLTSIVLAFGSLVSTSSAACDASTRLAGAKQVIYAYNLKGIGASATAFKSVPWGSPNTAGKYADGLTVPVPVATTGQGTYDFAVESRQAFSRLTGEYTDFPDNGTTLINTNVTLGVRSDLPIPITFNGHVYMDYDESCRIYSARAYAKIPISILNQTFEFYDIHLPVS